MIQKNNPKTLRAWALFDTANSSHALVITAAIFPIYYLQITDEWIPVGAFRLHNESVYAFLLSFAYLIVALITPLLSGIADYGDRRLWFMKLFTYIGSLSCMLLFFFSGMETIWIGWAAFALSVIGFAGGLVFYNAFIPIIATKERFDKLSAMGFSFGYVGSVLLLLLNLFMIMQPQVFGFSDSMQATRWAFLSVGIWWLAFAHISFAYLPKDRKSKFPSRAILMGYYKIRKVYRAMHYRDFVKIFLASFFLYSVGVQTIILLAATFAETLMNFSTPQLISIILLIQLIAVIGSYTFAWVSTTYGNKISLSIQIVIWIGICVAAYFVQSVSFFYLIAALVGMVMGGIQSQSRSSYAKLIEKYKRNPASYFSFYDVLEKLAIVVGTFVFGMTVELTGSMRWSALLLSIFFISGLFLLRFVNFDGDKNSMSHPKIPA